MLQYGETLKNKPMKTKEGILDEKKILRTAFSLIEIGENEDGSPYYLGTDDDRELDECVTIAESYASQRIEKYRELIEWLNDECPAVSPPLEPYTTADLSHDFAEILRSKLDDLKNELGL